MFGCSIKAFSKGLAFEGLGSTLLGLMVWGFAFSVFLQGFL